MIVNILLSIVFFMGSLDSVAVSLFGPSSKQEDVLQPFSEALGQGLAKGVANGIKEGIPGAIDTASLAMKNQFARGGDGYQGVGNIVRSVGDQFQKEGAGHEAIENFWGAVSDTFDKEGQGRRAAQTAGDSTGTYIQKVGSSFASVFLKNAVIAVGSALAVATVWFGSRVLWNYIDRQMTKPKVIIKSSRKGVFQRTKDLVTGRSRAGAFIKQPMIFDPSMQTRLDSIVATTQTIHQKIKQGKTNVKYRNLLLCGRPGTGKTLFANYLAQKSGMEFAMASGASFTKKGAIEAMDELFAWAEKSKGLLLFIDEAESLMPDRNELDPDSDNYQVLTNFLNYTGTRSNKFMIVLATNRLEVIDEAIHRRIDDLIELPMPGIQQRFQVLKAYRDCVLKDSKQNGALFVQRVEELCTDERFMQLAQKLEGFSNGDLEGLINIIKTESDASRDGMITQELIDSAVVHMLEKQKIFMHPQSKHTQVEVSSKSDDTFNLYAGFAFLEYYLSRFWSLFAV